MLRPNSDGLMGLTTDSTNPPPSATKFSFAGAVNPPASPVQVELVETAQHRLAMRGSRRPIPRSRWRLPGHRVCRHPRRPPGRGLGHRVAPMPPMRQHRLVRDPDPPAEIAGLHPSRLLPRHPDRAQEPEPAQQRQPVGTLRGLRQPPRLQVPQIRGDRADHPTGAVKQPIGLERIPGVPQRTQPRNHQRVQIPCLFAVFDHRAGP